MGKNKMGTCEQCGRTNTVIAKGLCLKHYHQLKRYGKFLDNNPRNRSDLNEIIKYDDYAEVVLYNYHSVEIARTKIDLSDINTISKYKWYCRFRNGKYTVITNINNKEYSIHRFITDANSDEIILHKNKDYLDNRRDNLEVIGKLRYLLRISSHANKSGVIGVYRTKYKRWCAQICRNNKREYLGTFRLKEDAIKSRKNAERKYRR